jgi:hypothetical protein
MMSIFELMKASVAESYLYRSELYVFSFSINGMSLICTVLFFCCESPRYMPIRMIL